MMIKFRSMSFAHQAVSSISNVSLVPEVSFALKRWMETKIDGKVPGVLIGGLAMSFYAKPRYTEDIDLLFLTDDKIPQVVSGFKKTRKNSFQEEHTHVEVEAVTPFLISIPVQIARKVIDTAITKDGIKVASAEGMIALKLFGSDNPRREFKDMADIVAILEHTPIDMSDWNLSKEHEQKLVTARSKLK